MKHIKPIINSISHVARFKKETYHSHQINLESNHRYTIESIMVGPATDHPLVKQTQSPLPFPVASRPSLPWKRSD